MKIELKANNQTKIFEDYSLPPMTVTETTEIKSLDDTRLVFVDCEDSNSLRLLEKYVCLMEQRYSNFEKIGAGNIEKFDEKTHLKSERFVLVYSNLNKGNEHVKNAILNLWQKSRASGIASIFIVKDVSSLEEPMKSSNVQFGF